MWARVAPLLRQAGHEVLAPSLTGVGERSHLASAAVDLSTHIADLLQCLRYERASGVVLVGHSYGGMVVTGVADRAPEPHLANLLDMDSKIADVVSLEETIAYLAALAAKPDRAPAGARRCRWEDGDA